MAIEWDYLLVETALLAVIIFASMYVENWLERQKQRRQEQESLRTITKCVRTDLENKMRFIDDTIKLRLQAYFHRYVGCGYSRW